MSEARAVLPKGTPVQVDFDLPCSRRGVVASCPNERWRTPFGVVHPVLLSDGHNLHVARAFLTDLTVFGRPPYPAQTAFHLPGRA